MEGKSTMMGDLSNNVTKVSVFERFKYALLYFTGFINDTFEIVDFNDIPLTDLYEEILGIKIPSRIQFSAGPSHLTAIASYDEGYSMQINLNTVDWFFVKISEVIPWAKAQATYKLIGECNRSKVQLDTDFAYVQNILILFWAGEHCTR